jgi:HSP20 family protein
MDKTSSESKPMTRRPSDEPSYPEQLRQSPHLSPDVDIIEREDELLLRADLPGVGAENVDVRVENQVLILSGQIQRRPPADRTYLVQEYEVYDFHREFILGEWVDATKITAEYADGLFTLHLPKAETMKMRRIQVQKRKAEESSSESADAE